LKDPAASTSGYPEDGRSMYMRNREELKGVLKNV
jgi:hypothetical protein